jgi:hypothetical protein
MKSIPTKTSAADAAHNGRRDALKLIAGVAASTLVPGAVMAQGTKKYDLKRSL